MQLSSLSLGVSALPQSTLSIQVATILRKFGTNAHVWMPGVGTMNGFQTANYLEANASGAPQVVDQPVGYVGDAANVTLGAELVANGDFSGGLTGWNSLSGSIAVVGGELEVTGSGGAYPSGYYNFNVTQGKTYQVRAKSRRGTTASMVSVVVQNSSVVNQTLPVNNATTVDSDASLVFTAASTGTFRVTCFISSATGSGTAYFDNISVREITGAIPATQSTTANKPFLRRGHVNRLLQSTLYGGTPGVIGSGAVAPTGWIFINSGGSVSYQPAASGVGNSIRFTTVNGRPAIGQSFAVVAGGIYTISYVVEQVHSGSIWLDNLIVPGGMPVGATQVFKRNGVVVPSSTPVASGDKIENVITVGATGGTIQARFGPGVGTTVTVDITCSNPQLETGSVANTYVPTTTAAASSNTGGYWWEFDGADDRIGLAAVPFQMEDDFAVVAGIKVNPATYGQRVFSVKGSPASIALLVSNTGLITGEFVDNAGVNTYPSVPGNVFGNAAVATLLKAGSSKRLHNNGAAGSATTTAMGLSTFTAAGIGSVAGSGGSHVTGSIYATIAIKGTVSDADLKILEKWVGQQAGVQIA